MSLRFIDSFAHYNTADAYRKWTIDTPVTVLSSGGRRNAPYMQIGNGGLCIFKTLTPTSQWVLGCAFYLANVVGVASNLFILGNGGPYNAGVTLNADNTLSLYNGNNFQNYRYATSTVAIQPSQWNYIEASFTFSGGTGVITQTGTVRVNGLVILTGTGTGQGQTGGSFLFPGNYMNIVGIGGPGNITWIGVQDFYALDSSPTDINGNTTTNTTFLGDVEVDAIFPAADVTTSMSTFGGDGTHAYSCVNETVPDDDTSYVYTSNTGVSEAFTYQPISGLNGTIFGAQYLTCCKKDAEGLREFTMTLNGGTLASLNFATQTGSNTSTSQYLADYYNYFICPLDSDAGVAWTTGNLNTATFGVTLTT